MVVRAGRVRVWATSTQFVSHGFDFDNAAVVHVLLLHTDTLFRVFAPLS